MLTACLGIPHISTGDMLREHIQRGDMVGRQVDRLMRAGSLVPDEMVNGLVEARLARPDCVSGFILDGYPRTRQQAETLHCWLVQRGTDEKVIHLKVDYGILIKRITGRRQCSECGALYNLASHPPKFEGICDLDGSKLVIREDDRESVIRERLEAYERDTRPLIEYFREAGRRLHELDASQGTPKQLLETICQVVETE